jgi:uncharacterized protein YifE (UPF0438 family)
MFMALPPDHTALLRQQDFVVPTDWSLSDGDRRVLLQYGRWLDALASGKIEPLTPEQEHFVRVARGGEAPATDFERAWIEYSRVKSVHERTRQESEHLGPMEAAGYLARLVQARKEANRLAAEHQRQLAALLAPVQARLDALDAEYARQRDALLASVQPQIDALAAEHDEQQRTADETVRQFDAAARQAVLAVGESVKHPEVHAVYVRGRVTWDSKGLGRYADTHPEVNEFRTIGPPSVQMRYQPEEEGKKE